MLEAGFAQQAVAAEVAADRDVLQLLGRQGLTRVKAIVSLRAVDGIKIFLLRFVSGKKLRRRQRRVGKGKITAVFRNMPGLGADGFFTELEADFGIGGCKGAQVGIDKKCAFCGRNAEAQGARRFFCKALHIQEQRFFCAADLAGLVQEGFPGFCQGQLSFAACRLDQFGAVIVFQRFDLGAEGGLGQGQLFGGCGQVACFGDGNKIAVKVEIHKSPLKYKKILLY